MKLKNRFPVATAIIVSVSALILYLVADYINLPSMLSINVARINEGLLGTVISVVIAIIIFSLTYYYVEQWNIRKHNNQAEVAKTLLKKTYEQCNQSLMWLDWPGTIEKLVERTDFNAYYYHNSPANRFSDIPFENENLIMEFAADGILTSQQINTYFEIKRDFSTYISTTITFYDNPQMAANLRGPLDNNLKLAISRLEDSVNE